VVGRSISEDPCIDIYHSVHPKATKGVIPTKRSSGRQLMTAWFQRIK